MPAIAGALKSHCFPGWGNGIPSGFGPENGGSIPPPGVWIGINLTFELARQPILSILIAGCSRNSGSIRVFRQVGVSEISMNGRGFLMRKLTILIVVLGALIMAPSANATITTVFGGDVSCSVVGGGDRFCGSNAPRSTTPSFDGVPIDVNVAFPPVPGAGPDGNFPVIMMFHGYGGSKFDITTMQKWLDRGYATFSMTDRGMGESCGVAAAVAADPIGCGGNKGYIHLMDTRLEVRDAQTLAGILADEGLIDPQRIGAWGGSYGGGMSMALAALKNRTMNPDGSLSPWTSPLGKPMQIAAAAPSVPWTDLAYSLAPNGSTLDYLTDSGYAGRIGVEKQSYIFGLYASRLTTGRYAPPGLVPEADLTGWKLLLDAGEPYDSNPAAQAMVEELTKYHSSYYIDNSVPPAPLLISSGWTDDLFPADEAIRYYNKTKTRYPSQPISLFFSDGGHARGQNKPADTAVLTAREEAWFDYYVKGEGGTPYTGVETLTQTCPNSAPSEGPYYADTWAGMAKGQVKLNAGTTKSIQPSGGDPSIGNAFDPITGGGACATASGADQAGAASYRVSKPTGNGFTLMGAPTVIADFKLTDPNSQVAARLLDIGTDGQETLVSRGLWRPTVGPTATRQVFQLHPNGYRFAAGHVAKLELVPSDAPYGHISNDQQPVSVSKLELRLPVLEKPGSLHGLVGPVSKPVVPAGKQLTADVTNLPVAKATTARGRIKVKGRKLFVKVKCSSLVAICNKGTVKVVGAPKKGRSGRGKTARGTFSIAGGKSRTLKLVLTKKARKHFKKHKWLRVKVTTTSVTTPTKVTAVRAAKKSKK